MFLLKYPYTSKFNRKYRKVAALQLFGLTKKGTLSAFMNFEKVFNSNMLRTFTQTLHRV